MIKLRLTSKPIKFERTCPQGFSLQIDKLLNQDYKFNE